MLITPIHPAGDLHGKRGFFHIIALAAQLKGQIPDPGLKIAPLNMASQLYPLVVILAPKLI